MTVWWWAGTHNARSLKLKQLNGIKLSFILLFSPVCSLLSSHYCHRDTGKYARRTNTCGCSQRVASYTNRPPRTFIVEVIDSSTPDMHVCVGYKRWKGDNWDSNLHLLSLLIAWLITVMCWQNRCSVLGGGGGAGRHVKHHFMQAYTDEKRQFIFGKNVACW